MNVGKGVFEKIDGQTNKPTKTKRLKSLCDFNKQTNETREPLSKGDSRTGLIAFLIQLPLATLASLTHFILHTSE